MDFHLDEEARAEREALAANIHDAFADVRRGPGAISWSECYVLDMYGTPAQREAARRSDTDTHWSQLIGMPDWRPFPGVGGFNFINTEGFRYYLPPTMIRMLSGHDAEWFPGHLLRFVDRFIDPVGDPFWTRAQITCIARFIRYMARNADEVRDDDPDMPNFWQDALEGRWKDISPG